MVEFLLGVDGGGTSTRALLARRDGPVIGQGQAGPSALGQGITQAYELGSGAVLKGLVKRIAETIAITTIGEPHEVAAFTS